MGIPKIIHYCWFGHSPLPDLEIKCIDSWKRYCEGYELIEWNELNFDVCVNLYSMQAYEAKKWAFVSDYVRLFALFHHGGIYLDTDVELIKPLDDLLNDDAFSGFEDNDHVQTGIIACKKGHPLIKEWLDEYEKRTLLKADKSISLVTNVATITRYMMNKGLLLDNSLQIVDGMVFYPSDYFCPKDLKYGITRITRRTYCVHHFTGSWYSENQHIALKSRQRRNRIDWIQHIPNAITRKILGRKNYGNLKKMLCIKHKRDTNKA